MNDDNPQSSLPKAGHSNGFLPKSVRAILRSASSLASSVRSAGSSVTSTITMAEEDRQREQLQWACFDKIELTPATNRRVLLLTYTNGFQVWDVENADDVWEIVSKRDGPVAFLRVQPQPIEGDECFKSARPLLLVVTSDPPSYRNNGGFANGYSAVVGSPPPIGENFIIPTLIKFYSLRSHSYVHTLRFRTAILAVRCSSRVIAVALAAQLYCFDATTLQSTFSVLTYPSPLPGSSGLTSGYGAVAVGPRWLAYAANQPLISNTGRVSPQHLTPSPGVSPSTSPANGSLVAHYAKESSKQLAAGIVTLGDLGYKALSRYCTEGAGSPVSGSTFFKSNCNGHPEHAGTVIVRDFVTKVVVSQFRAHDSPLSAISFDPTGTLLVTASIHGHNINIFRLLPGSNVNIGSHDTHSSHVHLYKLSRGMTNAVIQDIAFSKDSQWIVVSSSRGTNHLFAISPFGGAVGLSTHGASLIDRSVGPVQLLPWWSKMGPLRSSQDAPAPAPATVNLSVVSRIKNGNSGWRGTVSGAAAAAASGWTCSSFGAVAVTFHDGRGHKLDSEGRKNSLKEQMWVLSPTGHLIRHALHLSAGSEGFSDNISSPMASGSQKEALDLKVTVEPLQRWDLCRRPNWVEREEKMNISTALDVAHVEAGFSTYSTKIMTQNCGTLGREDTFSKEMTAKEMHQWFLSNAEVQMHHIRPPIWARSQIFFHVLSGPAYNGVLRKGDDGGEIEIEKVVSHVVEVRRKDLVPVFDLFRNYQFREDVSFSREVNSPSKGGLNPSSLQSAMHFKFDTDVGGLQGQRSCSGSSCGSEGSLYSGPNAGMNSGHHLYEEPSRDLLFQPMNPSFVQESQCQFHAERSEFSDTRFPCLSNAKQEATFASDFKDIPYLSHQDSYVVDSKIGEKSGVDCMDMLQGRGRVSLHDRGIVAVGGNDLSFPGEGLRMDVGCVPNGCHEGSKHRDFAPGSSGSRWVPCSVEEACPSSKLQTADLGKTSESLPNAIRNCLEKFDLRDYDAVTEDVQSDGNSKSEDFGGEQGGDVFEGEHGEDGWEGAMFPFIEDC